LDFKRLTEGSLLAPEEFKAAEEFQHWRLSGISARQTSQSQRWKRLVLLSTVISEVHFCDNVNSSARKSNYLIDNSINQKNLTNQSDGLANLDMWAM
jgi:hypothetical protein